MTRSNPRAKRVTVVIEVDGHVEAWQAEEPEEVSLNIDETSPLRDPYAPTRQGRSKLGVDVECGELSALVSVTGMDKVAELLGRVGTGAPAVPGEER